jgi:hypothetical protein
VQVVWVELQVRQGSMQAGVNNIEFVDSSSLNPAESNVTIEEKSVGVVVGEVNPVMLNDMGPVVKEPVTDIVCDAMAEHDPMKSINELQDNDCTLKLLAKLNLS